MGTHSSDGLNVLLVTVDTLRPDRLSCYNSTYVKTPNIDDIADRGMVFFRAFAHTPTTLASHANILLGTTPLEHGVHQNASVRISPESFTLAEMLKSKGYATAAFVGAYPLDARFGLDQGFDVYDDDFGFQDFESKSYVERRGGAVIESALAWLRKSNIQEAPWFLWIHLFDPHVEYAPSEPFASKYAQNPYEGEVAYVDHVLGGLVNYFEREGLFAKTLVVFTADHGESLGDHGEMTHGYFGYNSTLWVPLILAGPGIRKAKEDAYVCHIDIFPTICDLLGGPTPSHLQGVSLLEMRSMKNHYDRAIYFESLYPYLSRGWAPIRGIIHNFTKYIDSPIPEVYDLKNDFGEADNLSPNLDLAVFKNQLSRIEKKFSSNRQINPSEKVDRESLAKLKSLGYISTGGPIRKNVGNRDNDVKIMLPFHNRCATAMLRFKEGDPGAAVRILRGVIEEREDIDIAYINLADIYKDSGRINEALAVLKQGWERLPENYDIFLSYISCLLLSGNFQEVIDSLDPSSHRHTDSDPEIWNALGSAYMNTGRFDQAQAAFEKAVSIDPDFPSAWHNSGVIFLSKWLKTKNFKDYQDALQYFQKAIAIDPAHAASYNALGVLYKNSGRLAEALEVLNKAVRLDGDLGDALFNLGLIYLYMGDKQKALQIFQEYQAKFFSKLPASEQSRLLALITECKK